MPGFAVGIRFSAVDNLPEIRFPEGNQVHLRAVATAMWDSQLRQRVAIAGIASLVTLGVVGCGTESPAEPTTNSEEKTAEPQLTKKPEANDGDPTQPLPSPWEPSPADVPGGSIVFHRSGGIAGFADRLVVESDGTATLTSRTETDPVTCTVDTEIMAGISSAMEVMGTADEPKVDPDYKPTSYPDKIDTFVTFNDNRVQYDQLAKGEKQWRGLFSSLGQVLGSAAALRDGTASPEGTPACTA